MSKETDLAEKKGKKNTLYDYDAQTGNSGFR